jgi:predicted dithiol-disulfide oxidoreductase (DUF899 family)
MECEHCGPKGQVETNSAVPMPPVASYAQWQRARQKLLAKEKAATRTLDALAAERRRLPMVAMSKPYAFDSEAGTKSLEDLFDGRRQLIIYHFMYGPTWESPCPGCSRRMDDVGQLYHLHARQTSFVVVARAPLDRLNKLWHRKGWTMPVVSSGECDFNEDMGVTMDGDEDFGLSVFFRDDVGLVYRTYFTNGRGVEPAGFRQLLDMTPYGRQENWEDSPTGWPQSPTYEWHSARDK